MHACIGVRYKMRDARCEMQAILVSFLSADSHPLTPQPRFLSAFHDTNPPTDRQTDRQAHQTCPQIGRSTYGSSRKRSSSSVKVLPLDSTASSILSTLLNPMIGLVTLLFIQTRATWLIFQPFFSASSWTRPIIASSSAVIGGG